MTTEIASSMRQICQAVKLEELRSDLAGLLSPRVACGDWAVRKVTRAYGTPLLQPVIEWLDAHKARGSHGHGLGHIRRFKGL